MTTFTGFSDKTLMSKVKSYLDSASADVVELSTGFFRGFGCPANCGACCSSVALQYFKDSDRWRTFVEIYPDRVNMFKEHITEQGEVVMSYQNNHGGKKCILLDMTTGRCGIHKAAPLPCRIAPLKFIDKRASSNKTFLNASAYGRAWAFTQIDGKTKGAMCEILPFDYTKFENDLEMLKELRMYGEKLQIKTKLKYIIEFLEKGKDSFKKGEIPSVNIIFDEENTF